MLLCVSEQGGPRTGSGTGNTGSAERSEHTPHLSVRFTESYGAVGAHTPMKFAVLCEWFMAQMWIETIIAAASRITDHRSPSSRNAHIPLLMKVSCTARITKMWQRQKIRKCGWENGTDRLAH